MQVIGWRVRVCMLDCHVIARRPQPRRSHHGRCCKGRVDDEGRRHADLRTEPTRSRIGEQPAGVGKCELRREQRREVLAVRRPSQQTAGWRLRERIANAEQQPRSEEHTSELQSLMRTSYAVFCLKKKKYQTNYQNTNYPTCRDIYKHELQI